MGEAAAAAAGTAAAARVANGTGRSHTSPADTQLLYVHPFLSFLSRV
jgi:hypothetical protein